MALAGADDKCQWLEKELGVDRALNYKSKDFRKEFKEAVGYLDVFFDNVGGDILNLALGRLNKNARIVVCGEFFFWVLLGGDGADDFVGAISQYSEFVLCLLRLR